MYARQNNIKISYPIEIEGIRVPSAQWLAGQTQAWRDANSITIHVDPVKPAYDNDTQKLVMGDDGEWQVVPLSQAEIDARKPKVVTMSQARLALHQQGLLSQVDAAIASMPSPQKEAAQIEWEYRGTVERDNALVQGLAVALSLTETDLDNLFALAVTL